MSHTYSTNRVHVIFSTKERRPCIDDDFQPKLWAYMAGIAHNQSFEAMVIGGVRDHVHALLILPPIMPLAKAVQHIKGGSSKWINETKGEFAWQEGYGAFSVSASQTPEVIRYIQNQRSHHARKTFEEEFLEFLQKYNVSDEPAHVLG